MSKSPSKPYAESRLVRFLDRRILELRSRRNQAEVSAQAGFPRPNVLSMIKSGATRLPLDRVPALAEALECDPALLFKLAVEQQDIGLARIVETILGAVVTRNEVEWIGLIREASDHSDPYPTSKGRAAIRGLYSRWTRCFRSTTSCRKISEPSFRCGGYGAWWSRSE